MLHVILKFLVVFSRNLIKKLIIMLLLLMVKYMVQVYKYIYEKTII